MIGIGVDICNIERIKIAISQNKNFLEKYYTESEREYLSKRGAFYFDSAAAMFAAKEATLKAFGLGIADISLKSISVEHSENYAPSIRLYDKALDIFNQKNAKDIHISISHEKDIAIAFVILE